MTTGLTTNDRRALAESMARHPAGRSRNSDHTATIIPFPRATIVPTANDADTEKEN